MKKLLLYLLLSICLLTGCTKQEDTRINTVPDISSGESTPDTVSENVRISKAYSITDIIEKGASNISADSIPSLDMEAMYHIDAYEYSFYGSKMLKIPFSIQDIISSTDTSLNAYIYNDGTQTIAILYPEGKEMKEAENMMFYFNTISADTDYLVEFIDEIQIVGLQNMEENDFLINGLSMTSNGYQNLTSLTNGICSGFSNTAGQFTTENIYERFFHFQDSMSKYEMDCDFLVNNNKSEPSLYSIRVAK